MQVCHTSISQHTDKEGDANKTIGLPPLANIWATLHNIYSLLSCFTTHRLCRSSYLALLFHSPVCLFPPFLNSHFLLIPTFIEWHNLPEFKLLTSVPWSWQYLSDFRMLQVIVVKFQLHHSITIQLAVQMRVEGYVRTPSANLCASVTVPADKMVCSCSRVAVWY